MTTFLKAGILTGVRMAVLFSMTFLFAHEPVDDPSNGEPDFRSYSLRELMQLELSLEKSRDTAGLKRVLNWHIKRALTELDTIEALESYKWLSWIESHSRGIALLDSALMLNQHYSRGEPYFAELHYRKGIKHYDYDRPVPCFKSLLIALDKSKELNNHELFIKCLNLIAVLKMEYGQEYEALKLQQSSLKLLQERAGLIPSYNSLYIRTLDGLTIGYLHAGRYDSARTVAREGIRKCEQLGESGFDQNFRLLLAQINYYDGNLLKAKDTLEKMVVEFEGTARADILYYLGMIAGKLGNPRAKLNYFREVDSILSDDELTYLDSAEAVYEYLLQDALNVNSAETQRRYLEKARFFDSLVQLRELQVKAISHARFDRQMHQIVYPSRDLGPSNAVLWTITPVVLSLLGLYALARLKSSGRMLVKPDTLPSHIKKQGKTGLEANTEVKILEALKEWEKGKGFLAQEVTLSSLAKDLGTNSAYLSRVINVHKGISFANYIKDLRIKYAIDFIGKNRERAARMSTIQLAEAFGFKSQDVFVRSLKSRTGLTPSKYLKELKREQA